MTPTFDLSSTPTSLSKPTRPPRGTTPLELVRRIIHIVAERKDLRSLSRLQRASRALYLLATPLMYSELGPNYHDILDQLTPLLLLKNTNLTEVITRPKYRIKAKKHPIDHNRATRLFWVYSHVERIIFEPTTVLDSHRYGYRQRRLQDRIQAVQDQLESVRPGALLLPSVMSVVVNLAKLPKGRKIPEDDLRWGEWDSDDSTLEERLGTDEWDQRHPPIGPLLRLCRRCARPFRMCLNLEGHPLYHHGDRYNEPMAPYLDRENLQSVTLHRLTILGSVYQFPGVKNVILDTHPLYDTMLSRLPVYGVTLQRSARRTPQPVLPRIMVQRLDSDKDDEKLFKDCMDNLMADPTGGINPKVKLQWGYIEKRGEIKGCELCRAMFAKNVMEEKKPDDDQPKPTTV